VGTIDSFWDANMDMLGSDRIDLYDPSWPIRSRSPKTVPQFIGADAKVSHSVITEGCEVYGSVESSVLSSDVIVEAGAEVVYSILMPGAKVCRGARVSYAIIGENTVVARGATVGAPPDGSPDWGVATCGPNLRIGEGMTVPPHAMVYETPEVEQ
jgi:glucose-1-phosphate adenylyltransferase